MKKLLEKFFAWISECAACEQAMYEALYNARIKPLIDKILCRDEQITRLENEVADAKKELEIKKAEAPKPKRKYNKKKKSDDKA
jgi:AmiR/NasT family two-component response regulator